MVCHGTRVVLVEVRPHSGLTVRCPSCGLVQHFEVRDNDENRMSREELEMLRGLLDGTSEAYAEKPGPESPIGACDSCKARPIEIEIVTPSTPFDEPADTDPDPQE